MQLRYFQESTQIETAQTEFIAHLLNLSLNYH